MTPDHWGGKICQSSLYVHVLLAVGIEFYLNKGTLAIAITVSMRHFPLPLTWGLGRDWMGFGG